MFTKVILCSCGQTGMRKTRVKATELYFTFNVVIHLLFLSQDLKNQKYVKLSIVHCPPVTMAIIRRPDPKFQLGFSVEDGIVSQYSYFLFITI